MKENDTIITMKSDETYTSIKGHWSAFNEENKNSMEFCHVISYYIQNFSRLHGIYVNNNMILWFALI